MNFVAFVYEAIMTMKEVLLLETESNEFETRIFKIGLAGRPILECQSEKGTEIYEESNDGLEKSGSGARHGHS